MTQESGPDQLKEAREKALHELKALDPSWMASRSGASYSFFDQTFKVPFMGEEYLSSRRDSTHGREPADGAAELITSITGGPTYSVEQWVSYRDPGAHTGRPSSPRWRGPFPWRGAWGPEAGERNARPVEPRTGLMDAPSRS